MQEAHTDSECYPRSVPVALQVTACAKCFETLTLWVLKHAIFFFSYPPWNQNFASFPELLCCSHFTFTWCQAQTCAFNLKLFHYLNQILGFDVTADTLQRLRWIALLAKSIWWQVQCINPSVPLTPPVLLGSWFITTSAMTHCSSSRGARMQARRSEKHACYSWSV